MIDSPVTTPNPTSSTIIKSTPGRLQNEHFHLAADLLQMELHSQTFALISASARGHVTVSMRTLDGSQEYVIRAEGAEYRPQQNLLLVAGWIRNRPDSVETTAETLELPTDGTFFQDVLSQGWWPVKQGRETLRSAA